MSISSTRSASSGCIARPASICGLPSLQNGTGGVSSSDFGGLHYETSKKQQQPTSLGLYFQDGSSTLMAFANADLTEVWLQALSAVVATNRSRAIYPHIGKPMSGFNPVSYRYVVAFGALNWPAFMSSVISVSLNGIMIPPLARLIKRAIIWSMFDEVALILSLPSYK